MQKYEPHKLCSPWWMQTSVVMSDLLSYDVIVLSCFCPFGPLTCVFKYWWNPCLRDITYFWGVFSTEYCHLHLTLSLVKKNILLHKHFRYPLYINKHLPNKTTFSWFYSYSVLRICMLTAWQQTLSYLGSVNCCHN